MTKMTNQEQEPGHRLAAKAALIWLAAFLISAALASVWGQYTDNRLFISYAVFFTIGLTTTYILLLTLVQWELPREYVIGAMIVAGLSMTIPFPYAANLVQYLVANAAAIVITAGLGIGIAAALKRPGYILPLLLAAAAVDVASVLWGPTRVVQERMPSLLDHFMFHYPVAGAARPLPCIGLSDFVFAAFLFKSGTAFHLDVKKILASVIAASVAAFIVSYYLVEDLPMIPFLALFVLATSWRRLVRDKENLKTAAVVSMGAVVLVVVLIAVLKFTYFAEG